ncbi:MAG: hypothetical protein ABUS79_02010 [Pseudomonadota bacterium]
MPSPPPPIDAATAKAAALAGLDDLDDMERGFVLGILALGGDEPEGAALALTAPAATRCQAAVRTLGSLGRAERIQVTELWGRAALAAIPAGMEDAGAETLATVLAAESDDTIRLVTRDAPPALREAGARVLAARALPEAHLRSMPPGIDGVSSPDSDEDVDARTISELQRAVLSSI